MDCERGTLVPDNINTHTSGASCDAFETQCAQALQERIEFCCTPQPGGWLNVAEVDLGALSRQCLAQRRIGDLATLQSEIAACSTDANQRQRSADGQMTINDVLSKLKSGYPHILT